MFLLMDNILQLAYNIINPISSCHSNYHHLQFNLIHVMTFMLVLRVQRIITISGPATHVAATVTRPSKSSTCLQYETDHSSSQGYDDGGHVKTTGSAVLGAGVIVVTGHGWVVDDLIRESRETHDEASCVLPVLLRVVVRHAGPIPSVYLDLINTRGKPNLT